ncbi:unnamed protein product, partial [Ixodes pacificus]
CRHPRGAHGERGRRLRHLQQKAHGPHGVPGGQGDAGRHPGTHPPREGGLSARAPPNTSSSPHRLRGPPFPAPPPDPHLSAPHPYTSLLFFRSNKTEKRKKILLGAIWWERLLPKTLLVDSCKQILSSSLLVSLAVKRHFYAFWGLAKENRLLLLLLLLLMKAGGDLSNKKKSR